MPDQKLHIRIDCSFRDGLAGLVSWRHRLFEQDMFSRPGGCNGNFLMQMVRGCDQDDLDVRVHDDALPISVSYTAKLGDEISDQFLIFAARCNDLQSIDRCDRLGVDAPEVPGADNSNSSHKAPRR